MPGRRRRRLFQLPAKDAGEHQTEVDEELRFHFEMREAELRESGMSPEMARAQARREFGDVEYTRRYCSDMDTRQAREARRGQLLDGLWQDARAATRQLRHNPGYALAAILTLALGIGATTAIFGAVNGILLRPLPYADAERIMTVWQNDRNAGRERDEASPANFIDWRERATSFERLVALEPWGLDYEGPEGPVTIETWLVTDGFFEALQVPALHGRTFLPDEYTAGRNRVVVLTYNAWRARFGGDRDVIGRTLRLDGEPHLVAGVMPPGVVLPRDVEAWAPKVFGEEQLQRRATYYAVLGRLRPGVTFERARAEMEAIGAQLAAEHPSVNEGVGITVVPLPEVLVGEVRPALLILLAAVGLVLLIACANVANLMLARAVQREREFAIRAALGAGRRRLIRQLLTESLVLAAIAGAAGVLLARWGIDLIRTLAPVDLPRVEELSVDAWVLAFAVGVSILTALLFGLAPALRAAATNLHDELKSGGRGASSSRVKHRMRSAFVVGQIAMAMVLLIGAGLLARSFVALLQVERGYRTDNVLAVTVQAWQYFPDAPRRRVFVREALARIDGLPTVSAAGVTSSLPLSQAIGAHSATVVLPGQEPPEGTHLPSVHASVTTPGYFRAMGIALRQGRLFDATDDERGRPVVLVSETLARQHWPDRSPVGEQLRVTFAGPAVVREVIGVVADVRQQGLDEAPRPALYVPHPQAPGGALVFTVRTSGDPHAITRQVHDAIWALSPSMPIVRTATLETLLDDSLRERRFHLSLLGAFAVSALVLAVIGIYAVLSHAATERASEFGVRIALGATARDILRLTLRNALVLAAIGVLLGIGGALAVTHFLSGMLFGVTPLDPLTFASLAALLVVVALLASYVPARRATRVDPLTALRAG